MKFKKLINSKGQMGAPMELLVAVIIMGLVIIISTQLLYSTNRQVCKSNVEKEIYEFKNMIEDTAKRDSSNRFFFFPDNPCFDQARAVTNVERFVTKQECTANCGQPLESCYTLTFNSHETVDTIFIRSCLDVPSFTKFTSNCEEPEGFVAVDAMEKIPFGQYLVMNNTSPSSSDSAPEVCALYKKAI